MTEPMTVLMGPFNAECYWREPDLAQLPQFHDAQTTGVISALDSLLIALQEPGDCLVTRYPISTAYLNYAAELPRFFGSSLNCLSLDTDPADNRDKPYFQLFEDSLPGLVKTIGSDIRHLDVYAVVDMTPKVSNWLGASNLFPSPDHVRHVNSKSYSTRLCQELGIPSYGIVISDSNELSHFSGFDPDRGFLIKDSYGVSGKGNLLITSESMKVRIVKFLENQERTGKKVCFVLEPYLNRVRDFSSQLHIDSDGKIQLLSVQEILNNGLAYRGSQKADQNLCDLLADSGYMEDMYKVCLQLFRDGYWGDVCIDSMLLRDGTIVPVVEINARKSMGLLNHHLSERASRIGLGSVFSHFNVGFTDLPDDDSFLALLSASGLLYKQDRRDGIVPLPLNSLSVNKLVSKNEADRKYKGRLYFSSLADNPERHAELGDMLSAFLSDSGFNVFS